MGARRRGEAACCAAELITRGEQRTHTRSLTHTRPSTTKVSVRACKYYSEYPGFSFTGDGEFNIWHSAAGRSRAEEWRGLVAAGGTEDKEEACAWLFEWQDGIFALRFFFLIFYPNGIVCLIFL